MIFTHKSIHVKFGGGGMCPTTAGGAGWAPTRAHAVLATEG